MRGIISVVDLRDATNDMQYCLQKAFVPENMKERIDRINDKEEQRRLRKKIEGGSVAAISVMQYFMTNRKMGFRSWPRDLKYCECAIMRFFNHPFYSNYMEIRDNDIQDLKEYLDLQSNSLKYFVNEEILEYAFEIVQGKNITHILKCNIKEHTYEILKCFTDVSQEQDTVKGEAQDLDDEVDETLLVMSHMILKNPILSEKGEVKKWYFDSLKKYVQLGGWGDRKYIRAQMKVYSWFLQSTESDYIDGMTKKNMVQYRYFLLLDLFHILGYDQKIICSNVLYKMMDVYISDFPVLDTERDIFMLILDAVSGKYGNWWRIKRHPLLTKEREYVKIVEQNLRFRNTDAFQILVTATMSAGKSTFVNSLIGKNISLSQNMTCTSKIHSVIGKTMEDGFTYVYDHHLELMAGEKELFDNNIQNTTDYIGVGTYYNGMLRGTRMIIYDSPGINCSGEEEHKKITNEMIRKKNYDLMIYLINATQIGTNDDLEHLQYVKKYIGDIPIIFVINKIDAFDTEEEDFKTVVQHVIQYIKSDLGFKEPIVCPVSARAGYLARISQYENLSKIENGELNGYIDKFSQMNVKEYYKQYYPTIVIEDSWQEKSQLLKNCGISYVEKVINEFYQGGRKSGTDLCQI